MKSLLLASAFALALAPAAMAEVTLTVANNTSDSIATLAIFAVDASGQPTTEILGSLAAPVASGSSAELVLSLPECGPAYMSATYGDGSLSESGVDLCATPTLDFTD